MKVLFCINGLIMGGLEKYAVLLGIELNKDPNIEVQFCLISFYYGSGKEFLNLLEKNNIVVHNVINSKNRENDIIKIIVDNNIDLVHSHYCNTALRALKNHPEIKVKVVETLHNCYTWEKQEDWPLREIVDKFTVISTDVLNYTKKIIPYIEEKSKVITNKLIIEDYLKDDSIVFDRNKFGLNKEDIILGVITRLDKCKGVDRIINLWDRIKEIHPKLKLLIVGTGIQEKELREQAKNCKYFDSIIITGYVESPIFPIYKIIDIFLYMSYLDGMPTVLLEAMLAGSLILTTPVYGVSDLIISGKEGFIIKDEEEVVHIINSIMMDIDYYEFIRKNAKEKIINDFYFDKGVQEIKQIYRGLI
jgi:glycosyltransferase involved in cell wall biosynthesis